MDLPTLKLRNKQLPRDSTVYTSGVDNSRVETMIGEIRKRQPDLDPHSVDCHVDLKLGVDDPASELRSSSANDAGTARVIACRCFQGSQWSLTIRRAQDGDTP